MQACTRGSRAFLKVRPRSTLKNLRSDFLYIVLVGSPWTGAGVLAGSKGGAVRVRRLLAERPAAPAADPPAAAAPMSAAKAAALGLPSLRSLPSRRVLAAAPDASAAGDVAPAPKLLISLMQRNASAPPAGETVPLTSLAESVVTPQQLGLVPVTPTKACQLKAGASARCLLEFEGWEIDQAVYAPGAATYLVFSMEQPGQVGWVTKCLLRMTYDVMTMGSLAPAFRVLQPPLSPPNPSPRSLPPPQKNALPPPAHPGRWSSRCMPTSYAAWGAPRTGLRWPSCCSCWSGLPASASIECGCRLFSQALFGSDGPQTYSGAFADLFPWRCSTFQSLRS